MDAGLRREKGFRMLLLLLVWVAVTEEEEEWSVMFGLVVWLVVG